MSAHPETSESPDEPPRSLAAIPGSGIGCQHLKTWPKYFDTVERGTKTFEIRQNDRPFTVGTKLVLHEYDPEEDAFTGRTLERVVTYMTDWEQKPGFVVMSIKPLCQNAIGESRADNAAPPRPATPSALPSTACSIFDRECCPRCGGKSGFSYLLTIRGTQLQPWKNGEGEPYFESQGHATKHGAYRCDDCGKVIKSND